MYRDPYMNDFENRIEDARRRENERMSDWRNFVHSDHLISLRNENESFQLTAPEGEDSDEDSLGDQTTNGGSSIEIEIEDESAEIPVDDGCDGGRWMEAADYVGYEPYEPNPYDGTYSEM